MKRLVEIMEIKKTVFLMFTYLVLYVCVFGCGGPASDQPDLGLVKGVITFDGAPLARATVTFLPDSGRRAIATTDAEGKYELIYIRDTPGCKIGHNKVAITTLTEGEDEVEQEGDDAQVEVESVKEKIPAKYNTKTELEADVKAGENTFDFNLTGL
ncbi:carboxypeptidase regulatory-like domain-containing protein [Gimesia aquarii]|nr:carboxypeptidase regulatory-like domain-containing protein [Gimesia aquarii]